MPGVRNLASPFAAPFLAFRRSVHETPTGGWMDSTLATLSDAANAVNIDPEAGTTLEGGDEFEPSPAPSAPSAPKPGSKAGTPGAVPFRPAAWDFAHSEYVVQPDDTMVGIATTYLGRGDRWGEIRQLQTQPEGSASPWGNGPYLNRWSTKWFPGSTNPGGYFRVGAALIMPREALDKAKSLRDSGAPMAAAVGGSPGNKGGQTDPALAAAGSDASSDWSLSDLSPTVLIGGAAAVGLLVALAARRRA